MSDFEAFTNKGGRYVTAKTASVTMNHHGQLNVPKSVNDGVFGNVDYIEFHGDRENQLLALEGYEEGNQPSHAYTLSGDGSRSVPVERVLEWLGKRPPESHTMFELREDEESGLPFIDLSQLPDFEESTDE